VAFKSRFSALEGSNGAGRHINVDVRKGRAARELLWAFNPSEDGGVMLERAAGDDGVVIVAPLRRDGSGAELSTRPLTGVDRRIGRR
jgi:hypothetical protein